MKWCIAKCCPRSHRLFKGPAFTVHEDTSVCASARYNVGGVGAGVAGWQRAYGAARMNFPSGGLAGNCNFTLDITASQLHPHQPIFSSVAHVAGRSGPRGSFGEGGWGGGACGSSLPLKIDIATALTGRTACGGGRETRRVIAIEQNHN